MPIHITISLVGVAYRTLHDIAVAAACHVDAHHDIAVCCETSNVLTPLQLETRLGETNY